MLLRRHRLPLLYWHPTLHGRVCWPSLFSQEHRISAEDAAQAKDGTEPDARFSFANERTFLAWNRTALALVVAGLAIVQLLPPFAGVPWGRHLIAIPLIVLGAVIAVASYVEWQRNQRALRRGEPLPRSVLPRILAGSIAVLGALAAALVVASAVRR